MARANEVSRVLAAAGHRRVSTSRTAVRGWTTYYAGFRCSNMSWARTRVEYEPGSEMHTMSEDTQREIRDRFIAKYAETLDPLYEVTKIENTFGRSVLVIYDKPTAGKKGSCRSARTT